MENKRTINVLGVPVVLDSGRLFFSENTLSEYLEKEGGWIDYFGAMLADAERQFADAELSVDKAETEYDELFAKYFTQLKSSEGGSDKFTEGKAKLEPMVVAAAESVLAAKKTAVEAKHSMRLLQQHLKAWQLNHDNAQNRGNTLRKEMDRLNRDVIYEEKKLEDIIKEVG